MQLIPLRDLHSSTKESDIAGQFMIWNLSELLSGKDMKQELHRHSFYFLLIVESGTGKHIIDFYYLSGSGSVRVSNAPRTSSKNYTLLLLLKGYRLDLENNEGIIR